MKNVMLKDETHMELTKFKGKITSVIGEEVSYDVAIYALIGYAKINDSELNQYLMRGKIVGT